MPETLLVTHSEYQKAKNVFEQADGLCVLPVAGEESVLASAIRRHRCRAVIVGVTPYVGPLYESLASVAGRQGAIIARFGVGHDGIDKTLAAEGNITVTNTPGVLDQSVAEHTLWLLGNLAKRVSVAQQRLFDGNFCSPAGMEVTGKTLGIVGFGAIGRRVAAMAHFGFAMKVLGAGREDVKQLQCRMGKSLETIKAEYGLAEYTCDVDQVFRRADVVSLHLAANAETQDFVDRQRLGMMKPGALLINTARGSVVDEDALFDALATRQIAGAALDVFQREPYVPLSADKDLRTLPSVVLTPHIGSNTKEANRRTAEAALGNVKRFFAGAHNQLDCVQPDEIAFPG